MKCRGYEKEGVRMIIRLINRINIRLNRSDHIRVENCALAHSVGEMNHHVESRGDLRGIFETEGLSEFVFCFELRGFLQNFTVKGQR
jgi:hypothetical protein